MLRRKIRFLMLILVVMQCAGEDAVTQSQDILTKASPTSEQALSLVTPEVVMTAAAQVLAEALQSTQQQLVVTPCTETHITEREKEVAAKLQKRRYVRYAAAAALAGGVAYWLAGPTGTSTGPVSGHKPDDFATYRYVDKHIAPDFFSWVNIGGISLPYMISNDMLNHVAGYLKISTILGGAGMGVTQVFGFREDIVWFYEQELHVPSAIEQVRAFAVGVEEHPACPIRKKLLQTSVQNYFDNLTSLTAFMRHKVAQASSTHDVTTNTTAIIDGVTLIALDLSTKINTMLARNDAAAIKNAQDMVKGIDAQIKGCVGQFIKFEDQVRKSRWGLL